MGLILDVRIPTLPETVDAVPMKARLLPYISIKVTPTEFIGSEEKTCFFLGSI